MNPCNKKGETDKDKEKEPKQKISSPKKEEEPSVLAMASTSSNEIAGAPNPKKSKMEKGLAASHEKGPEEEFTFSSASSFASILKASAFVDKTMLIKNVFQTGKVTDLNPTIMITAPRKFGKSVNLDMLRCFLELEVDENTGKAKTQVCDTPNYKLFTVNKNSEKMDLQIMADNKFVKTHFGKYPIINVSFLCTEDVISKTEAVNLCRTSIHEAFIKHPYLYESSESRLKVWDRDVCEQWCTPEGKHGNPNYKQFDPNSVIKGLKDLSKYLNKFHGRKVFVLIDEFDSIVSRAVGTVADKDELRAILGVVMGVIGSVVKDNSDNVAGVFITGILDLHGTGISSLLGNVERDTFGDDKPRLKYYGFNLKEVEKLFEIFSVDEGLRKKAITKYNGYYTERGEHGIFNPYAIVQFLKNREMGDASLQNYWQASGYVESLDNLFQKYDVTAMIKCMLRGGSLLADFPDQLNLENLTELHIANRDSRANISVELVGLFLLRQGYISYRPRSGSLSTFVGIPEDLRPVFTRKLVKYLRFHCGMNNVVHTDCKNHLNTVMDVLINKDKAGFIKALKSFTDKLGELIQTTSIHPCNEAGVETVVSSVVFAAGYTCGNQTYNIDQNRLDMIAHKDGQGIIIELKYNKEKNGSRDALAQLFTKGYYKEFINENHYDSNIKLRLVMGLHFTEKIEGSEVKATVHCLRDVEINEVLNELNIEKVDKKGNENVTEDRITLACERKGIEPFLEKAIRVT